MNDMNANLTASPLGGSARPRRMGAWAALLVAAAFAGALSAAGQTFRDCTECPLMVVVPAGKFLMGSPKSEQGRDNDEGPVHLVTIARPFAVGVYEVTRGEYRRFVDQTGHEVQNTCSVVQLGVMLPVPGKNTLDPGFDQTDAHPVVCVTWKDAKAYVHWLSKRTGKEYRLLSEAEWEYVARAGTSTAYWWGDLIGRNRASCRGCGSRWDGKQTAPVGSFRANAFGLHDVHGNVWEWVEDCRNESYPEAPSDGSAWQSGDCDRRARRGGGWGSKPRFLRSANRGAISILPIQYWNIPGIMEYDLGFRVARTLGP